MYFSGFVFVLFFSSSSSESSEKTSSTADKHLEVINEQCGCSGGRVAHINPRERFKVKGGDLTVV